MVSEIFNGECDAMVDMTLTRPLNKGRGTNRFIIRDFLIPGSFIRLSMVTLL